MRKVKLSMPPKSSLSERMFMRDGTMLILRKDHILTTDTIDSEAWE